MYTGFGQTSRIQEVQKVKYEFSWVLHHQAWLKVTIHTVENSVSNVQKAKVRNLHRTHANHDLKDNGKYSHKNYIQINGKFTGEFTT